MSDDLISRQALLEQLGLSEKTRKYCGDHSGYETMMLYEIQDVIESAPSVQPKGKTGKWKQILARRDDNGYILRDYKCTNCFGIILNVPDDDEKDLPRYCCMCGAKMEV